MASARGTKGLSPAAELALRLRKIFTPRAGQGGVPWFGVQVSVGLRDNKSTRVSSRSKPTLTTHMITTNPSLDAHITPTSFPGPDLPLWPLRLHCSCGELEGSHLQFCLPSPFLPCATPRPGVFWCYRSTPFGGRNRFLRLLVLRHPL